MRVDYGRPSIHASGQGRSRRSLPVFELVNDVVMQVIQETQPVESHGVGFLGDRSGYDAVGDEVERLGTLVHRHDRDLAVQVQPVERFRRARAARVLYAHDAIDLFLRVDKGGNLIIGGARVAFVIQGPTDFDPRIFLKLLGNSADALVQVELSGYSDQDQLTIAVHQLGNALPTDEPGLIIIRTDE